MESKYRAAAPKQQCGLEDGTSRLKRRADAGVRGRGGERRSARGTESGREGGREGGRKDEEEG